MGIRKFKLTGEGQIRIYDSQVSIQEVSRTLALEHVEVTALGKRSETLEDYFLKITEEVE